MKAIINAILIIYAVIFSACHSRPTTNELNKRLDSLEAKLNNTYQPGLGELMGNIQVHHNKLWFAGINRNWELANFELDEIRESLELIRKYQNGRKESEKVKMLIPSLDTMEASIQYKDPSRFITSYKLLTNTCNDCHRATEFEFNKVKIPETPPFSNQDFKVRK